MRVAMIGSGYVGLVSGACFADFGHDVICVDKDPAKIDRLNNGIMPIFEPGLDALVTGNAKAGRLTFTTELESGIADAEAIFIAVGTPSRRGDGHADLSYVYAAAREIALAIKGYTVIVTKSTVPVGTGDEVERIIREANPAAEFAVVSNPEFLREGAAIGDFKRPDRIVVGTEDPRARDAMTELYRPLFLNRSPILFTTRRTAELIKYAANAFLATKISFINEMADLCEAVGADVQDVSRGIGQDAGAPVRIVETVAAVNDQRKRAMAKKVIALAGGDVRGKTVAVLGLTFKPNTDDMRDSPAIAVIQALQDAGASIRAFDPEGEEQARLVLTNVDYAANPYACLTGADVAVLVTEWDAFRALDMDRVKTLMKTAAIADLRNVYRPDEMARRGIAYASIGR